MGPLAHNVVLRTCSKRCKTQGTNGGARSRLKHLHCQDMRFPPRAINKFPKNACSKQQACFMDPLGVFFLVFASPNFHVFDPLQKGPNQEKGAMSRNPCLGIGCPKTKRIPFQPKRRPKWRTLKVLDEAASPGLATLTCTWPLLVAVLIYRRTCRDLPLPSPCFE